MTVSATRWPSAGIRSSWERLDDDIGANSNQGSAYVFATWGRAAEAVGTSRRGANDHFGTSVAISGDTVVVGSPNDDIDGNFDQGSAYVFVRRANPGTSNRN